jgi:putative transposase
MDDLHTFIRTTRDARELKRALAVQNSFAGRSREDIAAELGVSASFVGKWRWIYGRLGVAGLRVGYKGSTGYLSAAQRAETLAWIQAQSTWNVPALQAYMAATYGIRYRSPKSYYTLLRAAGMSWKKSQAAHPDADPAEVAAKREEIQKKRTRKPRR